LELKQSNHWFNRK